MGLMTLADFQTDLQSALGDKGLANAKLNRWINAGYYDLAGAVEARRHCNAIFVTVAMHEIIFRQPVYVGDVVSFYTETKRIGTTSITVRVRVEAIRVTGEQAGERIHVTEGEVVYVAMDQKGNKLRIGGI